MNVHRVLIVEDDPDDRHMIARAFRKANVEAELDFAEDGDQALAYLDGALRGEGAVVPTVILLDLKLPRRSGFEVLAYVKADGHLRRVPVVILTSSRESTDLARAYDLGANSYLVKPVRPDALLQIAAQVDSYWLRLNEQPGHPRL
ncbi:MAG TPA: response regulator [Microvirga sp.]|jgi:CheY-like chemotaxis protein